MKLPLKLGSMIVGAIFSASCAHTEIDDIRAEPKDPDAYELTESNLNIRKLIDGLESGQIPSPYDKVFQNCSVNHNTDAVLSNAHIVFLADGYHPSQAVQRMAAQIIKEHKPASLVAEYSQTNQDTFDDFYFERQTGQFPYQSHTLEAAHEVGAHIIAADAQSNEEKIASWETVNALKVRRSASLDEGEKMDITIEIEQFWMSRLLKTDTEFAKEILQQVKDKDGTVFAYLGAGHTFHTHRELENLLKGEGIDTEISVVHIIPVNPDAMNSLGKLGTLQVNGVYVLPVEETEEGLGHSLPGFIEVLDSFVGNPLELKTAASIHNAYSGQQIEYTIDDLASCQNSVLANN